MNVKVWAHRGASAYRTENTLEAFALSIELGADGIELDVQLTKDQEIVVFHDESLNRISNGSGFIKDYTLAELKALELHGEHPEGGTYRIPTLREVYELMAPTTLLINVELKTSIFAYDGIEKAVLELTKEMKLEDRVLYSSFNHQTLRRIKGLKEDANTAILLADVLVGAAEYIATLDVCAIHPFGGHLLMPEVREEFMQAKLPIHPWTINEEEHIRECMELGVAVVITNYPDRAIKVREGMLQHVTK